MSMVNEVDTLVKHMKENVSKMQTMMKKWKSPLFERRLRTQPPEELDSTHQSLVGPRLEDIKNHGRDIHKLMKETADYLKPDKKSINWLAYIDYVNGLVIEGITNGIDASLKFLSDQISIPFNKTNGHPPMFLCSVNLNNRDVIFEPSIGCNSR
jgi:dynein heavy chain